MVRPTFPEFPELKRASLKRASFAAHRLDVDLPRFYDLVRDDVFPPGVVVRLGRHIRVNADQLEEFIASGGARLPGGWKRKAD